MRQFGTHLIEYTPNLIVIEYNYPRLRWIGAFVFGIIGICEVVISLIGYTLNQSNFLDNFRDTIVQLISTAILMSIFFLMAYFFAEKYKHIEINKEKRTISFNVLYFRPSKNTGTRTFSYDDFARIRLHENKRGKITWAVIEFELTIEESDLMIDRDFCKMLVKRIPDIEGYWKGLLDGIQVDVKPDFFSGKKLKE